MGCCGSKDKTSTDKNSPEDKKKDKKEDKKLKSKSSSNEETDNQKKSEEKVNEVAKDENEKYKEVRKSTESGYVLERRKLRKKEKSLSKSNYNQKGLIADGSEEFNVVKEYLTSENRDYKLITSIGSGSYAEVYKAWANKYNKPVAVKVIALRKANDRYRQQFLPSEIKVMKECKHENIIKVYEISQRKNRVYVIMEFAENGTWTDWLRNKGPFSEKLAKVMFGQILRALDHMHCRHIAHRDLKLENILVNGRLIPKLSDFSYAMKFTPGTPMSTDHCGSLPYFAPELLQKKPYNPLISDIWSLGVCFFVMVNDGLPFSLGDDNLMLKKQLNKEWRFKKKVDQRLSEQIKSIIRRMLEPELNSRITSTQLMNEQWFKDYLK